MQSRGNFDLGGRVALVTGGASGIGAGLAAVLAEAGATRSMRAWRSAN